MDSVAPTRSTVTYNLLAILLAVGLTAGAALLFLSTKAPARDTVIAQTDVARRGSGLFDSIGCATCHARNLVTAPAGTKINGGTFTVPPALGNRLFHPFSDFLMHDVGTGDGIEIAVVEHFGKRFADDRPHGGNNRRKRFAGKGRKA